MSTREELISDESDQIEIEASLPRIDEIVEKASSDVEGSRQSYQDAMDFFLDDANDVEKIPLEEDIKIKRTVRGVTETIFVGRIRTIDERELKSIRERSKEKMAKGMRGAEAETDEFRFYTLIIATALIQPDLTDAKVIAKFKTVENALRKRLLPGERFGLGAFILDRSGFGDVVESAEREVEAAKN